MPKFIKKYAGLTLGDMELKDLAWWAENYEPKPFRGKISPSDLDFRAALDLAVADGIEEGGNNSGPHGDDGPF